MSRLTRKQIGVCIAALVCAIPLGCKVGPDYHKPDLAVKQNWPKDEMSPATTRPSVTTQPSVSDEWWKEFHDPHIDALVARALKSSYDLKIAASRVLQSRAQNATVASRQLPNVNATAGFSDYRHAGPLAPVRPEDYQWYYYGFDSSWELDIFGGIQRAVESSTATYQATIEASHGVRLSLIAEVVRNYVELRTSQRRLTIASENLKIQEHTLSITRERFAAGVVPNLDVYRASSLVEATRSTIPPLKADAKRLIRNIGVLLGEDPDALEKELEKPVAIPVAPAQISVGLPADLIRRRPDLRQAERQLAAATARIGVATADLYPHLSLLGSLGAHNVSTNDLFDWSSRAFGIGPSVSWNIFDAGRTRARIDTEKAAVAESLAQYQKILLSAIAETENEMTGLNSEHEREHSLQQSVQANRQSVSAGWDLYLQGVTDFTTVLDAERSLTASEDALALTHQSIDLHAISLCKALGGSWQSDANRRRHVR